MKKFFLYILLFFALTSTTHAQLTKGTVLTGIDLGAATTRSESSRPYDYKTTNLLLAPTVGLVIKDNTLMGMSVSYGRSKNEYETSSIKTDHYGAGAYYRRYMPLGKKFFLFGQAGAGYAAIDKEETFQTGRTNSRESVLSLGLSPGVAYTITKRFQLETGLGSMLGLQYQWDQVTNSYPSGQYGAKRSGVNVFANASPLSELYIGIRLVLGR
jgi:hypothetical protein